MKARELVLLLFLFVLVCSTAFYLLVFTPLDKDIKSLERGIVTKTQELDSAELITMQYTTLSNKEKLAIEALEVETKDVPTHFRDDDIINEFIEILTEDENTKIYFDSRNTEPNKIGINIVNIEIATNYETLQEMLHKFNEEGKLNRIINVSYVTDRAPEGTLLTNSIYAKFTIEYLTGDVSNLLADSTEGLAAESDEGETESIDKK